jgi:hypothetical protein
MIIISHRGFWLDPSEKNQEIAFERSFLYGFGTETDIRDYCGDLVISHDIPDHNSMPLSTFFEIYNKFDKGLPLALNIKADGLQERLKDYLQKYDITNYFVFDMAVPDGLSYVNSGLKTFTRESEYERAPAFYEQAVGIWLDEFFEHWIDKSALEKHLNNQKFMCIVSPDLHKRTYEKEWANYKEVICTMQYNAESIMLCTDHPEQARNFFHGK